MKQQIKKIPHFLKKVLPESFYRLFYDVSFRLYKLLLRSWYFRFIIESHKHQTPSGDVVVKLNVQEDHVRIVVVIPQRIAVTNAIQYIKTQSAKKLKAKFPFIQKTYTRKGIWSRGYCVSCIGLNEKEILA